jgi:autotransporter-associated beta strand protein
MLRTPFAVIAFSRVAQLAAIAQIPAFPGAEGFGAYATGGRGGDVYYVTNRNTSGTGSLANGIANAPAAGRTIVFAVSGYIPIPSSGLRITKPKITIAGQTAPGDGIGLRNGSFRVSAADVIIRHLRFRHGKNGSGGDCLNLDSGSQRCMLDHVSLQFSTDENFSSFSTPPDYMTFQWSINAWGLVNHSAGGLWDQNRASCLHSLWAHNHTRNPKARPNTVLDWVNNVTFDWNIGFIMGDSETPANWKANVRNSYFLCPPGNLRLKTLEKALIDRNGNKNFSLYLNNSRHDHDGDGQLNGTDKGYTIASGDYITLASPVATTGAAPVSMADPLTAFKRVASSAGALRPEAGSPRPLRDEVDTKLANNLLTQTRNMISRESDLGLPNSGFGNLNSSPAPIDSDQDGMPDNYENALGWNPAAQDHNSLLSNGIGFLTGTTFMPPGTPAGYTRLEEYLHFKSMPHAFVARNQSGNPSFIDIDLRKFTAGFVKSPVFTLSGITNGSTTQSGSGNAIVRFTPTLSFSGRARFEFIVTDADGSSWTQTCALLVTVGGLPRDVLWQGGLNSNVWDTSTQNWQVNASPTAYNPGDNPTFDDTGSRSPAVGVSGVASIGNMEVTANGNYSFTGSGSLAATGNLVKSGAGRLTLGNSGNNSFGPISLEQGEISISNNSSLGSATVTMSNGTRVNMGAHSPTSARFHIAGDATLTGGSSNGSHGLGQVTGDGHLTIAQTNVFDLHGDISGFAGTMRFTGNSAIRLDGAWGSSSASFVLEGGTPISKRNNTTTIDFGSLAGNAGTSLTGASGSGNTTATTYSIGANGRSATFNGNIANGQGTVHLIKTGTGLWTFGGNATHTGNTSITAGMLALTGSITNPNPLNVSAAATLALQGGSANVNGVNIPAGASLHGWGTLGGTLDLDGTWLGRSFTTGTPGMLAVNGSLLLDPAAQLRMGVGSAGSDRITVTGNLTLGGTLGVSLAPGTLTGTHTLLTYSGTLTNNTLALSGIPAGVTASIDTATPGQVKLVLVGDDNLLNEWETFWYGNLAQGDASDSEPDGFTALQEMIAGSNPTLAASTPLDTDGNGIPDAFEIIRPYQPDAHTLHLWSFDTLFAPVPNAADPLHPLLGLHNSATLWKPGPGGFGTALDTNTGTSPNKGILTYAATLSSATTPDTPPSFTWHGENGAFTLEAVVKLGSLPATWALPGQIICMEGDGDGTTDRVFQFRMRANGGTPLIEFFPLASGVSGSVLGTLPTSGIHAPNTLDWFHVAVTYDGNPGAPDNLKLYWTRLVEEVTAANEIGSGSLAASFTSQQGDFSIGNEARSNGGSTEFFPGLIDEVRISSIARQPEDFFFKPADFDEDGLPDAWEQSHFGMGNLTQGPDDDFDNDGTSNLVEYMLGLGPADGSSAFRATASGPPGPGGFTFTWPAAPGLSFRIERSTTLSGTWTDLGPVQAMGATGSFTDENPPAGGAFYRATLTLP